MARGGFRPGAGRKPKAKAAQVVDFPAVAAQEPVESKATNTPGGSFALPDGQRSPDLPENWPFGTVQHAEVKGKPEEPKAPTVIRTAREYLHFVVNDPESDPKLRLDAAKRLIEFEESKPGAMGKKEERKEAAKRVSGGKFGAAAVPLALVK